MQTKLQVEISEYSFLEIPIEADNINFILHEVDRINSIVDQHYEEKNKDQEKKTHSRWVFRAFLVAFFAVGILYGIVVSKFFPEVMAFFFH